VISRTEAAALIPEEASREIIQNLPQQSAVMGFARQLPNMSRGQLRMPVVSALATAYFVSGDTGLKQTTEVNWENKYIYAEELACIVPIGEAVLDDADYDIWAEIRPSIEEALGKAIDQAVLYGTNIPAQWTTSLGAAGLLAACTAASHTISAAAYTDMYEAIMGETGAGADGLLMLIEADGYMATGHIAHTSMKGKLRNLRDADGNPIFKTNTMQERTNYALDGERLVFPLNGSMIAASALQFCGDWSQLLYSVRQDITYKILDQAVLQDAAGNIIYNLAQQDMVALRAVMRLGFALPNPPTRENETAATRLPFSAMTA
jgi:HK97 family phage major capsid protein